MIKENIDEKPKVAIRKNIFKLSFSEKFDWNMKDENCIWDLIYNLLNPLLKKDEISFDTDSKKNIVCVDFESVILDASQLFRFLGKWHLHFPISPLIIVNIDSEIYYQLLEINHRYFTYQKTTKDIPYWNDNALVVVYSYKKLNDFRFYFTDILWGKNEVDFNSANDLVAQINSNICSIFKKENGTPIPSPTNLDYFSSSIKPSNNNAALDKLRVFGVFYQGRTLLPYDVLLKTKNDLSFFEESTIFILNRELDINKGF